ncbi:nuclear factor interleukin-3-regulated protein [Alosa sapidissima]|uniref:nuclear factor interleukin-3-regulated protein n=1 Tax=Alosa sapidissima TaxID=34773 RepID=UPI001C09D06C|nr:nuclear factor interleukin-3-regulated protein [Alosa sapidissima]
MCTPLSSTSLLASRSSPSSAVERSWDGGEESPVPKSLVSLPGPSLLSQRLLRLQPFKSHLVPNPRRKREMTPASKKDALYWDKRRKNNEAAKRSREKRRLNDMMLEGQLLALSEENAQLRAEVFSLQCHPHQGREPDLTRPFPPPTAIQCPVPVQGHPLMSQPPSTLWGFKGSCVPLLEGPRSRSVGKVSCLALSQSPLSVYQRAPDVFSRSSPLLPSFVHPQSAACVPHPEFIFKPTNLSQSSAEASSKPHKAAQVSSSDDVPVGEETAPAPLQKAFPPQWQVIPPQSLPSSPQGSPSWLLPHLGQTALHDGLLVPWNSSCFYPSSLYPSLPLSLYLPLKQAGCTKHVTEAFRSRSVHCNN